MSTSDPALRVRDVSPQSIILGSPCPTSPWSRSSSLTPLPDTPDPELVAPYLRPQGLMAEEEAVTRRTERVRKPKEIYDPSDEPAAKVSAAATGISSRKGKGKARADTPSHETTTLARPSKGVKRKRSVIQRIKQDLDNIETSQIVTVPGQPLDNTSNADGQPEFHPVKVEEGVEKQRKKRRQGTYLPIRVNADLLDSMIAYPMEEHDNIAPNQSTAKEVTLSEAQALPLIESSTNKQAVLARVPKRGRKSRQAAPLIGPVEPRREGYITSSNFARVLRLVAGLRPPLRPAKSTRVEGPIPRPPVWAESRQELCEALPYYRAFQSGLYANSRIAYGYLLEAFPAPRDIWAHNGRVVISHGGGQCVRTTNAFGRKGGAALQADQSATDSRVDTLLNAYHNCTPIVLIAGEGYEALPFALGCAYAVLGWYWISHVWVEAEPVAKGFKAPVDRDYFHRYKVRFDWVESQGRPWWDTFPSGPVETGHSSSPLSNSEHNGLVGKDVPSLVDPVSGLATPPVTPPKSMTTIAESEIQSCTASTTIDIPIARFVRSETPVPRCRSSIVPVLDAERIFATSDIIEAAFQPISRACQSCQKASPRIYDEGWTCVNHSCSQFWLLDTRVGLMPVPPGFSLGYTSAWLQPVPSPRSLLRLPYDVCPPPPASGMSEVEQCAGDRTLWKGWVCPDCRRANCRFRWEIWECVSCGKTHAPLDPSQIIYMPSLTSDTPSFLGDAQIDPSSDIEVELGRIPGCVVKIYILPRRSGRIFHIMPDDKSRADSIWELYQIQSAATPSPLFQRRALANVRLTPIELTLAYKGQLLAQHFAVNSGANYKYNVDTLSLNFEDSPICVIQAKNMITEHVRAVLDDFVEFNEVLSVLYREGQKMSWHDDGEVGLGPVVASLSLGSSATMSWRPKTGRIVPNQGYHRGSELKKGRNNPDVALSLTLEHGDLIVMAGEEIQTRYSHRVVPLGFRVAATARYIAEAEQ